MTPYQPPTADELKAIAQELEKAGRAGLSPLVADLLEQLPVAFANEYCRALGRLLDVHKSSVNLWGQSAISFVQGARAVGGLSSEVYSALWLHVEAVREQRMEQVEDEP